MVNLLTPPSVADMNDDHDQMPGAARSLQSLPAGWRLTAPGSGVLLSARPRVPPASGTTPTLVLTGEPARGTLPDWADAVVDRVSADLASFDLEDGDDYAWGLHDVSYRRFSHRLDGTELISELWAWVVDGVGYTLTGTVAREDYADYCDIFEAVADTFNPDDLQQISA